MELADFDVVENCERIGCQHGERRVQRDQIGRDGVAADAMNRTESPGDCSPVNPGW